MIYFTRNSVSTDLEILNLYPIYELNDFDQYNGWIIWKKIEVKYRKHWFSRSRIKSFDEWCMVRSKKTNLD